MNLLVFVDSDVVISSLLSDKGASYLLFQQKQIHFFISNYSRKELSVVAKRLGINNIKLEQFLKKLTTIDLKEKIDTIKKRYRRYVTHKEDSHIVFGAVRAGANFLLTYNLRHYKKDEIREDLKIIVLTPALFLQYLRSRN